MLDVSDETQLSEEGWTALPSRVELPCSWEQYASGAGVVRPKPTSRRQYCRVGLRSIAILWLEGVAHATYTTDVSKLGMGFYSPVNLLPRQTVQVWLPGRTVLPLTVQRCRRVADRCFECGAKFLVESKGKNAHDSQGGEFRMRVE